MITVYVKKDCSFCHLTIKLLEKEKLDYELFHLNDNNKKMVLEVAEKYKQNTFPFIFCDGNFIGGYNDLCLSFSHGFLNQCNVDAHF